MAQRVYGPYTRKDGRQHVILIDGNRRRTVSYPKWLMEQHLGRDLDPDLETVHHKDHDFTNNHLDNLEIIPRQKHAKMHVTRTEDVVATCIRCHTAFVIPGSHVKNRKRGKSGPFCSKRCSGKASHNQ